MIEHRALVIEYAEPQRFRPYAKNARVHSPEQIEQIKAAITEFGFNNPMLVDEDDEIIAGHGRQTAALSLGLPLVPFIVLRGLTEEQKRALRIADNKLALNASWDADLLAVELADLKDMVELTGFAPGELQAILAQHGTLGNTDPDEVPEPPAPEAEVSIRGDLWVCGKHRILCGDATSQDDVGRLLNGVQPHLMVTDPPYGLEYDANWRNTRGRLQPDGTRHIGGEGRSYGARAVGEVTNDDRADWREAWALFPGEVAYVWHASLATAVTCEALIAAGFDMRAQIIWAKNNIVISRGHYHWQHEPCWYAVRQHGTGHWHGDRSQTTLWQIDKPLKSETGHSTQKPVECMRRPIVNNSSIGQVVYDPFLGSGTTIIAAEMEGRSCYALEIAPAYIDVAVKRWQAFTGKEATLDGDGRTFDEIAVDRKGAAPEIEEGDEDDGGEEAVAE